ncbi:MAG: hypothetical protein U0529_08880 [Thermoanaerobaculia bacterium]
MDAPFAPRGLSWGVRPQRRLGGKERRLVRPDMAFQPGGLDAVRPVVAALAPIFYLLCTMVMLSLVANALGFRVRRVRAVTIPLVLMSFLMTPRDLIDLVFVMYSWISAIAVTAVSGSSSMSAIPG